MEKDARWLEVLAKSVAMFVFRAEKIDLRLEQAKFLEGLGLTRTEAAALLRVDKNTLEVLASREKKKKKKGGRGGKAKSKQ